MTTAEVAVEETREEIIATYLAIGTPISEIARKIKAKPETVKKIISSEGFSALLATRREQAQKILVNAWISGMADLMPLAREALIRALKAGNINAVRLYLESSGGLEQNKTPESNATLQIILPDLRSPEAEPVTVTVNGKDGGNETNEA